MAELATIARPYAEALFKASLSDLNGAAVWVEELETIAKNPQLLQFSDNPNVTAAQVYELIAGVAQGALPAMAQNFLRTVIENGRLSALPEIAAQFRVMKNELAATLEQRFARKLNVSVQLQPELIGGIRVVVGDEVLDSSVKARLEQMKMALTA